MPTYTTFTECIKSGRHLTDCDEDGYCNFCGYQDAAPSTPMPTTGRPGVVDEPDEAGRLPDFFSSPVIVSEDGTWLDARKCRFVWLPDDMNDEFGDWSDSQRWQYAQANGHLVEPGAMSTDMLGDCPNCGVGLGTEGHGVEPCLLGCRECGELIERDPGRGLGWVHHRDLGEHAFDLDEDHVPVPDTE